MATDWKSLSRQEKIDRRWTSLLSENDSAIRMMAERLSKEPVLRALYPFISVEVLFRFSTTTEWPYTVLPWLEIQWDNRSTFHVRLPGGHSVDGQILATGTLEEMVPVLVREVEAALAKEPRLFHH